MVTFGDGRSLAVVVQTCVVSHDIHSRYTYTNINIFAVRASKPLMSTLDTAAKIKYNTCTVTTN